MAIFLLGVKNLNELRAKDLAKEPNDEDEEDSVLLTTEAEVAEALKEIEAIEELLREADLIYKDSLYIRIGCLCHKVGFDRVIFVNNDLKIVIFRSILLSPKPPTLVLRVSGTLCQSVVLLSQSTEYPAKPRKF